MRLVTVSPDTAGQSSCAFCARERRLYNEVQHIEIVSPWRRAGVPRYIAAAEIGGGELFDPVVPTSSPQRCARSRDWQTHASPFGWGMPFACTLTKSSLVRFVLAADFRITRRRTPATSAPRKCCITATQHLCSHVIGRPTKDETPVYNRLEQVRIHRGLSRHQLAGTVGVHYQTIGYLERGEYSPSLSLALRLADVLEIPVGDMFSMHPWVDQPTRIPEPVPVP